MVKNMPFKIEGKSVHLKYTEIWNKIKKYKNYIKTKVQAFGSMINTFFSDNEIPREKIITSVLQKFVLNLCIESISVFKNYPQTYLEQK